MKDIFAKNIEKLRSAMEILAKKKGSLNDPEVLAMSQELDSLIVYYHRLRINRRSKS